MGDRIQLIVGVARVRGGTPGPGNLLEGTSHLHLGGPRGKRIYSPPLGPWLVSRTCGRCLIEFPGIDGRLLAWCNRDKFFVCGRCVKECRKLHGTNRKSMGFPAIVSALMILLLLACFAPSSVALTYEYTRLNLWRATAVTPIGSALVGQTIKIFGTIVSESSYAYPVALSGHEAIGRGCTWIWDAGARFAASDGTGTVFVTVARYWEIADGPHPNPARTCNIPESQYYVGDPVVIWGNLENDSSGATVLQASVVSPNAAHPVPNLLGWAIVTPFLVLCVGLSLRTAVLARQRLALHRKSLEGKASLPLPTFPDTRDPGLPWQKTYAGSALLDRARYAGLFAAFPWALPAVYLWLVRPHSQNEYYIMALFATLSAFLAVSVLFTALTSRVKPSAMAVTQAGIHFWYERAADRYELDAVIPWSDVQDVRMGVVGKIPALILALSSGGTKSFPGLGAEVRDAILAGWRENAVHPSPEGIQ